MSFLNDWLLSIFDSLNSLLGTALIAVIIILIVNNSNKKKARNTTVQQPPQTQNTSNVTNAEVAPQTQTVVPQSQVTAQQQNVAPQPQKPKDSSSTYNVLLYLGSFFIVSAMFIMAQNNYDMLAAMLFLVTITCFGGGLLLHRLVKQLRPVGAAFTITSLFLFPIWFVAFQQLGIKDAAVSLLLANIISIIANVIATAVTRNRAMGWLSYLSLLTLGNVAMLFTHDDKAQIYTALIWPAIISYIPTLLWGLKVKWLPIGFRSATRYLADILIPIVMGLTTILLFAEGCGTALPFLRTITAALALGQIAINFAFNRSHNKLIGIRFCAQAFVLCLVADCLRHSMVFNLTKDQGKSLVLAIVWLVGFLAQAVISLITTPNKRTDSVEHFALGASLFGIFATSILCIDFDATPRLIINLAMELVVAILGVVITINRRNMHWGLATTLPILYVPIELSSHPDIGRALGNWFYFAYYAIVSFLFVLIYWRIKGVQKRKSFDLASISLALSCLAALFTSWGENWPAAGWILGAVILALFALVSKRNNLYEGSIYLAALAIYSYCGNIYDLTHGQSSISYSSDAYLALALVRTNVLALSLFITGVVKERKTKGNTPRMIIGYLLFTVPLFILYCLNEDSNISIWTILYIVEEVGFLLVGVFTRKSWLVTMSSIFAVIATLCITGGPNFIWLFVLGVGLIAIVAWNLMNGNSTDKNNPQSAPTSSQNKPDASQNSQESKSSDV